MEYDPTTKFRSMRFKEFCGKKYIKHVECQICDHKGNEIAARLIRTVSERLRASKGIIVRKDNSGLSETIIRAKTESICLKPVTIRALYWQRTEYN